MITQTLLDLSFLIKTVPVTAASSITPASFTGLTNWYKADSFSLSDGTAIGGTGNEWLDQSGNANDLTQPTSGNRPVYKTSIVNSKPVIRFTAGSGHFLILPTVSLPSDFTVVAIASVTGDSQLLGNDSQNMQVRIKRSGANTLSLYFGNVDTVSSTLTNAANTFRYLQWSRFNDSSGAIHFRENASFVSQTTNDPGSPATLNRVGVTSFGGNLDGDIAELCIYTSGMVGTDSDSLYNNYFKSKYGLP